MTFEISGGADGDRFEIVADDQLVFKAAPDFETKLDSNADNIYEVELTADDGNGLTTQQTVLVTVLPVNDLAPVFTSPMTVTVPENTTAVSSGFGDRWGSAGADRHHHYQRRRRRGAVPARRRPA